jgi:hypothetical protein
MTQPKGKKSIDYSAYLALETIIIPSVIMNDSLAGKEWYALSLEDQLVLISQQIHYIQMQNFLEDENEQ